MGSDHSERVSPPRQPASPQPASPQSDPIQLLLNHLGPYQSEPPRPKPDQPTLGQTSLECSGDAEKRPPQPRRRTTPRHDPAIQVIPYKKDRNDPARLVRPHLEFVFPDGSTRKEPLTDEKSGYEQVQMEPEIGGKDWMSKYPIHFTSPYGLVFPFGQQPKERLHILFWMADKEPRHVMPHLFPPSRSQPLPSQPFPRQPLPPLNQQPCSAVGSYPQPRNFNDYQPPECQMSQTQEVGDLYQPALARKGAYQRASVPDQAPDLSLGFMNVQDWELDSHDDHMPDFAPFLGGEVLREELLN